MARPRAKGTAGENAVVNALRPRFPMAERRAARGSNDAGDIAGIDPRLVIEVKAATQRYTFGEWLSEVDREMRCAQASVGVVWAKQRGKGQAEDWIVAMRGSVFLELLEAWVKAH